MSTRHHMTGLLAVLLVSIALFLSGCYGLRLSEKGMHYQTEKAKGLDSMKFTSIGVYALSDGKIQSIRGRTGAMGGYGGLDLSRANGTDPYGFTPDHYPDKIEIPFTLLTDSANAGPSFEIALAMQKQLEERGFNAKAATDAPHRDVVTSEAILRHAAESGHDAAFMITYTLFNRWQRLEDRTETRNANGTRINDLVKYSEGFLAIPNAALVDVKTGRILWSSSYYGIVMNAQTPNISNQAFCIAVNSAIIENGRDTYVEAAKIAVDRIFNPTYWRGSYVPFPTLKQKKDGDKFDF